MFISSSPSLSPSQKMTRLAFPPASTLSCQYPCLFIKPGLYPSSGKFRHNEPRSEECPPPLYVLPLNCCVISLVRCSNNKISLGGAGGLDWVGFCSVNIFSIPADKRIKGRDELGWNAKKIEYNLKGLGLEFGERWGLRFLYLPSLHHILPVEKCKWVWVGGWWGWGWMWLLLVCDCGTEKPVSILGLYCKAFTPAWLGGTPPPTEPPISAGY